VSAKFKEDSLDIPAEEVKEEPESIIVEPNLHLEENDGNRFELLIHFQLEIDRSFAVKLYR
jgi:hypothetical protein